MLSRFTAFSRNWIHNKYHNHWYELYRNIIVVCLMGNKEKHGIPWLWWQSKTSTSMWFHINWKYRWHQLLQKPKGDIKSSDILEVLQFLLLSLSGGVHDTSNEQDMSIGLIGTKRTSACCFLIYFCSFCFFYLTLNIPIECTNSMCLL